MRQALTDHSKMPSIKQRAKSLDVSNLVHPSTSVSLRKHMDDIIIHVNNWSDDVNMILEKIRINSILLSNEHKKSYFLLASKLKWFRIPMIMLSTMGSVIGVGLPKYISIETVGIVCSILSLIVSLIGSLELFLAIGTKMESELIQSKELYLLAIEIQKTLLLDNKHRNGDGIAYLEDKFNMYSKLIEHSQLLECRIIDELTPLPEEYVKRVIPSMMDLVKLHNKIMGSDEHVQNHVIKIPRIFPHKIHSIYPFYYEKSESEPEENIRKKKDQIHDLEIPNALEPVCLKLQSFHPGDDVAGSFRRPDISLPRPPENRVHQDAIYTLSPSPKFDYDTGGKLRPDTPIHGDLEKSEHNGSSPMTGLFRKFPSGTSVKNNIIRYMKRNSGNKDKAKNIFKNRINITKYKLYDINKLELGNIELSNVEDRRSLGEIPKQDSPKG